MDYVHENKCSALICCDIDLTVRLFYEICNLITSHIVENYSTSFKVEQTIVSALLDECS